MTWKFFALMILLCLCVQGFYAMLEMACVSFNKVRLQYYVSKNHRRAKWLSHLLNHPAQLFGTTLIGVNAAMQLGSELSRQFYISLGISPDFAPLSQVFIVLIFAEISPLFAGRRYAEHVAMLGVPIIYFTSILLRPIIWLFDLLCRGVNRLVGSPGNKGVYLSREELQKVLEQRDLQEGDEFDTIVSNIFSLKKKTAKELMQPLNRVELISSNATVAEMRSQLIANYSDYLPLYQRSSKNIVAIAYPRDLLRLGSQQRVRDHAKTPWFITEGTSILQILKQFQRNNQSVAIVLNPAGLAIGVLTLDEVIDEIFGRSDSWMSTGEMAPRMHHIVVDRKFPGTMNIADFNKQYHVHLESEGAETLEDLFVQKLGHPPEKGEQLRIDQFELEVEEAPLIGEKMISIRTVY